MDAEPKPCTTPLESRRGKGTPRLPGQKAVMRAILPPRSGGPALSEGTKRLRAREHPQSVQDERRTVSRGSSWSGSRGGGVLGVRGPDGAGRGHPSGGACWLSRNRHCHEFKDTKAPHGRGGEAAGGSASCALFRGSTARLGPRVTDSGAGGACTGRWRWSCRAGAEGAGVTQTRGTSEGDSWCRTWVPCRQGIRQGSGVEGAGN